MPSYIMTNGQGVEVTLTTNISLDDAPTYRIGQALTFNVRARNTSGATISYNKATIHLIIDGSSYRIADITLKGSSTIVSGSATSEISATHCKDNDVIGKLLRSTFRVTVSGSSGGGTYANFTNNAFYIEDTTTAPVFSLNASMFSDPSGAKDRFGSFVQSNSALAFALPVASVDIGNEVTGSGRVSSATMVISDADGNVLFSKSKSVTATATAVEFDADSIFAAYGNCKADVSLTGLYGKKNTQTIVLPVAQYEPPSLTQNGAEEVAKRFRREAGDSGDIYIDSPEGESVLLAFVGYVQPFSGMNTYTITARYGEENAETLDSVAVASGTDADVLVFDYNRTAGLLPNTFSVKKSYQVEIAIVDWFGNQASLAAYVEKATPDYTHNANGLAVGMYSTATPEAPKFEVAETHESHFYGGIAGVTNYPEAGVEELTGGKWIDGSPIYRFVWTGTTKISGSQARMCYFPNQITPSMVVSLRAMVKRSDGEWLPVPNSYYGDLKHSANIRTEGGNGVYLGLGSGFDGTKTVVIVAEYVK